MRSALDREIFEEIGIIIESAKIKHIIHRVRPDRVYFSIYFEVEEYSGEIQNLDPDKCSELRWASLDSVRSDPLFTYDVEILEHIEHGTHFSETGDVNILLS